jgi:hypothetical protein
VGEAKRRQYTRAQLLAEHPDCIYCGAPATTTDHFPPRCFFRNRTWPETYEFAACQACQDESRSDEQVVAALVRMPLQENSSPLAEREWQDLVRGVKNNRPDIIAEMAPIQNRNTLRKKMRDHMGSKGDDFRRLGWGMLELGPNTTATIHRFIVKLAKALYYRHNGEIFYGRVHGKNYSAFHATFDRSFLETLVSIAPLKADISRSTKPLSDQFNYRFNYSPDHGVLYAVVEFSLQFLIQILAIRDDGLTPFLEVVPDMALIFSVVEDCPRPDR